MVLPTFVSNVQLLPCRLIVILYQLYSGLTGLSFSPVLLCYLVSPMLLSYSNVVSLTASRPHHYGSTTSHHLPAGSHVSFPPTARRRRHPHFPNSPSAIALRNESSVVSFSHLCGTATLPALSASPASAAPPSSLQVRGDQVQPSSRPESSLTHSSFDLHSSSPPPPGSSLVFTLPVIVDSTIRLEPQVLNR
ncbi:hypothetical protein HAX54_035906 [Datura stramonium]|uniref:Uncharacterized protein n=1 Tax=Datura stramonium TaxID=4076 RepID=A0ABS8SG10_DATST|nr:hypothetical protein [Datura stramonium]